MTRISEPTRRFEPWRPGESGNPSGRAKGVIYAAEWLKMMAEFSVAQLLDVKRDTKAPAAKLAAADMALQAARAVEDMTPRDQREAFSVVADRTTGKPAQEVKVLVTQADRDPAALIEDLRRRHALPGVQAAKRLPDTTTSTEPQ